MPRKGQVVSEKAKIQMKLSKLKLILSKYDWNKVKNYWDTTLSMSSRNRKIKFITFREYKKWLDAGYDLKDIRKLGISRGLLQFFSNFLQDKIHITEKQFKRDYIKYGKSLPTMVKKYGITRDDITFLRQLYDIKATGPKYQERKRTEKKLTQRQLEILYGTMLGDAKRISPSSAQFQHSMKQKAYLMWKYKEMENISHTHSLQLRFGFDKRYNHVNFGYRFYSLANTDIENCIKLFYSSGEKEVYQEILNKLTPLSLTVWFMDDGTTRRDSSKSFEMSICTDSFSKENCELIIKYFKEKWNIDCCLKIHSYSKKENIPHYRIVFEEKTDNNFIDIIKPYMLPSMKYKIDYNAYLIWKERKKQLQKLVINATPEQYVEWKNNDKLVQMIREIEKEYDKLDYLFTTEIISDDIR
jgi:hypothetical protein